MSVRQRYFLLFILLLLLALLAQWPATVISSWMESRTHGQWRLASAQGTLWQGGGRLLTRPSDKAAWHSLMYLNWRIHPTELLYGRLAIDLQPEQGQMHFVATPSGFRVESLATTLPASALAPLLPGALGRYHWDGQLHTRSSTFACDWQAKNCQGLIEILWDNAGVSEIAGPPLGNYRLTLTHSESRTHLSIETRDGRLQLKALGEITPNGQLTLQGEAIAPTQTGDRNEETLNSLLALLMRPQGEGRYLINYREHASGSGSGSGSVSSPSKLAPL